MSKMRPESTHWQPELKNDVPRYQVLVNAMKEDIASGKLKPGDRLPTQRALAQTLNIAIGTVTRAYKEASRRGMVRIHGARGTFIAGKNYTGDDVLGIPDPESQIIEMSVDLPLHAEDPDLGSILYDLAGRHDLHEMLRYHEVGGLPRHRRAGVSWMERFGVKTTADQLVVCAGTQHALTVSLMSFAKPGDVVLCNQLTYPGIKSVASHLHLQLVPVESDEKGLLPRSIETICKRQNVRALYCVPSLHNPTTSQLSVSRRRAIAKLADRFDFAILEDDVHRLMSDSPPPPLKTLVPARTYYIASFSKAVTGGLRVAFLAPPADQIESVCQAIWATVWMVPTLPAEIAAIWIEDGTAEGVATRKRAEAQKRQAICAKTMPDAKYFAQSSSYYIWLHLPQPWSSSEFAFEARQRGVAVTPSNAFVVGGTPLPAAVRACIAAPDRRVSMEKGLNVLKSLLNQKPGTSAPLMSKFSNQTNV